MCGIVGYAGTPISSGTVDLAAGCAELAHRGPDAQWVITLTGLGLGGTRLAVSGPLGLVPPAPDGSPGRALVYNGELYGPPQAHPAGDTGWLADRLSSTPPSAANFDGMYAYAAADLATGSVTLCRDTFGIKPLFLARDGHGTTFASELAPLARWQSLRPRTSSGRVLELLGLGTTVDGNTLLDGVEPVPAGGSVRLVGSRCEIVTPQAANAGREGMEADLSERIIASVQRAAEHDGPLGLFLSAGVDSRTIAHVLALTGVRDVRVFSLATESEDLPRLDDLDLPGESWRAWTHDIRAVSDADFWRAYEEVLLTTSQPAFPPSNAFVLLLAEMAAEAGVRVALSGEGVDELFGGYASYLAHGRAEGDPVSFYAEAPAFRLATGLLEQGTEAEKEARARLRRLVERDARGLRGLFGPERAVSLRPLLARLDHATMRRAVETRVPFLHYGIPELAEERIDWSLHGPHGAGKPVFRAAVAALCGDTTATAPKRPLRARLPALIDMQRRKRLAGELTDPETQRLLELRPLAADELARRIANTTQPEPLLVALRVEQVATYLRRLCRNE